MDNSELHVARLIERIIYLLEECSRYIEWKVDPSVSRYDVKLVITGTTTCMGMTIHQSTTETPYINPGDDIERFAILVALSAVDRHERGFFRTPAYYGAKHSWHYGDDDENE